MTPATANDRPAAQDLGALRQVFASVNADSCPYQYNFHMHTTHSDGQLSPHRLAEQALELGLKGFAITDHHQISGFYAAQAYFAHCQTHSPHHNRSLPALWTGVEITAILLETEVHILGYGFNPDHNAIASYLTGSAPTGAAACARQVVSGIHQSGGLAVLAHPARYRQPKENLIPAAVNAGIDGVETYYAYNNPKPWRPSPDATEAVEQLSAKYHLLNTCGTDTHGLNLQWRI
jgi:predicted metal-dependent phosphoesterase TrpH